MFDRTCVRFVVLRRQRRPSSLFIWMCIMIQRITNVKTVRNPSERMVNVMRVLFQEKKIFDLFQFIGGLYQHRHRCHPYVRGNKLICPICPKTFDQESALLAHKVQHKKTIQRSKHKCIVCSATFSQKQYLQVHCKRKHDASGNNSFDKTNKLNNETDDVLSC